MQPVFPSLRDAAQGNADEVEPEELHIDPWLTLVPGGALRVAPDSFGGARHVWFVYVRHLSFSVFHVYTGKYLHLVTFGYADLWIQNTRHRSMDLEPPP